ncbi:type III secretion system needle filament subunit SctF [Vibrio sp. S4M6]|uniref:type III secretion system needle filament subunit SctF n=1 Tax=Vibrio sinus TaxID=2946865 RepID=UPI00202A9963|nr:type III secretion system needle filament subunit SctF [Vibrio sinus]MCL9783827.1 type III secretion system needle filament subunit SctF [Vibrio sinus]
MDLQQLTNQLSSLAGQASQEIQSKMTATDLQDPDKLLQAQFAVQQYSTFVNYESAIIKTIKDMLSGIIQKI